MAKSFKVSIVTAEQTLLETDATSVDITSGADTTAYSGLACGDLILP